MQGRLEVQTEQKLLSSLYPSNKPPLLHKTQTHPQHQTASTMDAMLKNIDKETLKKGADTVVDKAAEQLGVDAAKTEKAKEAAHQAIDR